MILKQIDDFMVRSVFRVLKTQVEYVVGNHRFIIV